MSLGSVGAGSGAATRAAGGATTSPSMSAVRELIAFALAYTGGNARPKSLSARCTRDCDKPLKVPNFVLEPELCEAAGDGGCGPDPADCESGGFLPPSCTSPPDGAGKSRGPAASRDLEGLASIVLSSKNAEVAAIRGEKCRRNGRRVSSGSISNAPTSASTCAVFAFCVSDSDRDVRASIATGRIRPERSNAPSSSPLNRVQASSTLTPAEVSGAMHDGLPLGEGLLIAGAPGKFSSDNGEKLPRRDTCLLAEVPSPGSCGRGVGSAGA